MAAIAQSGVPLPARTRRSVSRIVLERFRASAATVTILGEVITAILQDYWRTSQGSRLALLFWEAGCAVFQLRSGAAPHPSTIGPEATGVLVALVWWLVTYAAPRTYRTMAGVSAGGPGGPRGPNPIGVVSGLILLVGCAAALLAIGRLLAAL